MLILLTLPVTFKPKALQFTFKLGNWCSPNARRYSGMTHANQHEQGTAENVNKPSVINSSYGPLVVL